MITIDKIHHILTHTGAASASTLTPLALAREIVRRLTADWSDPNLVCLEPCCGQGTFLFALYEKLLEFGHSPEHITQNMLYACDINRNAIRSVQKSFQLLTGYELKNAFVGNALEIDFMKKFDLVIANPPYQSGSVDTLGKRNITSPLWPRFIKIGMEKFVKADGSAAFITPMTWTNKALGGSWGIIVKYAMVYLDPNVKRYFPSIGGNGGTFGVMILKQESLSNMTELPNGQLINVKLEIPKNNRFITNEGISILNDMMPHIYKLDVKIGDSNPSINSSHYSNEKTETHVYETYYSGKKDRRSIWCDKPIGDYGKLKLIVAVSGNIYNSLEISTKGVGRQACYVLGTQDELEFIKEEMMSNESKKLNELMTEGNFNNALKHVVNRITFGKNNEFQRNLDNGEYEVGRDPLTGGVYTITENMDPLNKENPNRYTVYDAKTGTKTVDQKHVLDLTTRAS